MTRRPVLPLFLMSCCLTSLFFAAPALAQTHPLSADAKLFDDSRPRIDPQKIPALKNLTQGGGELFYMGDRSGLSGWFLVRNHQVQMLYVTPDEKSVIIGALFTRDGANVTAQQIAVLTDKDKRVHELVEASGQQQEDVMRAGGATGGVASVPSQAVKDQVASSQRTILPTVAVSPGDRLSQDLTAAAGLEIGKEGLPEIQIVVSPDCPKCESTWKELRPSVVEGKLRVRLIPIYNEGDKEEARQAAQLLRAENPMETWDKYVAGDKEVLAGEADSLALRAAQANLSLITRWNISGLPYLVYRNKDEKIKIVQGRPDRMATVLMDLIKE